MAWSEYIERLTNGLDLEASEISSVMETILQGGAEVEDIKNFLLALKAKGETAEEVGALVIPEHENVNPEDILSFCR